MSVVSTNVGGASASKCEQDGTGHKSSTALSNALAGIDRCIRRWKASRNEGQAVLTELSNALLFRTYVDKGRDQSDGVFGGGGGRSDDHGGAVWGALAHAGATVSMVSIATEARVRRLHGDLSALQDAMMAAAGEIRRHAHATRRCCCMSYVAVQRDSQGQGHHPSSSGSGIAAARVADPKAGLREKPTAAARTEDGDEDYLRDHGAAVGGGYGLMDVADAASEVAQMFLKEALVTATVVQRVGQEVDGDHREALTVYAAAWMMQPYVDARRLKELETMVGGSGKKKGRG